MVYLPLFSNGQTVLDKKEYLVSNKCEMSTDSISKRTCENLFSSDHNNSGFKFYLSGEFHYRKGNSEFKFQMLKRLHLEQNVRVLIIEQGYAEGWLVNKYLETGDRLYLKGCDYFEMPFYSELKKFNDTLKREDKIIVFGIDYEKSPLMTSNALFHLFNKSLNLKEYTMTETLSSFMANNNQNYYIDAGQIEVLFHDIDKNKYFYQTVLKTDYEEMLKIKTAFEAFRKMSKVYYNSSHVNDSSRMYRELFLFSNAVIVAEKYTNVNYFGQFGDFHVPLEHQNKWLKYDNVNSFASMLNNKYNGKVCTMPMLIKTRLFSRRRFSIVHKNMGFENDELAIIYELSSDKKITLFYLNSLGSPFSNYSN